MKKLIYSIEDDKDIAYIINKALTSSGYEVKSFSDGESFFDEFNKKEPDLILLDMMLPKIQGSEILKYIRQNKKYDDIDIIIISANKLLSDKIDGLNLGADDYIEKPFEILELISRVNARFRKSKNHIYQIGNLKVDEEKRIVLLDEENLKFTNSEFDILLALIKAEGKVVSRESLMGILWGNESNYESRIIDMHITSIRKKVKNKDLILTIHGHGYRINE